MRKKIFKISIRVLQAFIVTNVLIIALILNPSLLYAKQIQIENITVYYSNKLPEGINRTIENSLERVSKSEVYDGNYKIDICLNDNSFYPKLIAFIKGKGFAHGFYNKVVITSTIDIENNTALINNRKWNLEELLAHEMVHCYQYNLIGLKTLVIPTWKLEGYAEYVARGNTFSKSISEKERQEGWVSFDDGTGCPINYYNDYLKVRKLMASKNYKEILE